MQDVYSALEDIADGLSERAGHAAYIFEVISANPKKLALLMVRRAVHGVTVDLKLTYCPLLAKAPLKPASRYGACGQPLVAGAIA